ncbi:hypothetical protein CSKR_104207 [Clonorchis sinensis]|uniref:Uncharacterized protein n=1 Tax=Clonorchis sinensis TaxID=79923 RepID=A0A419Q202_CLOSI|nr:hypothetical protein CSKR_104207 [Clonorchis sinensis]
MREHTGVSFRTEDVCGFYTSIRSIKQSGKKVTAGKPLTSISRHFLQCFQPSARGHQDPKLLVISFTPFCQVIHRPPFGLNHSEGGAENNTRLGKQCFGMRSTWPNYRRIWRSMFSASEVPDAQRNYTSSNYLVTNSLTPSDTSKASEAPVVKNLKTFHIVCPQRPCLAIIQQ